MEYWSESILTGIQVVAIYATDLERARKFYVDLLGLPIKQWTPSGAPL